MTETNNRAALDQVTFDKKELERKENWRKFWKIMKVMPLFFVMPLTAFGKMQEVLMPPTPEYSPDTKPTEVQ